ncbi:MAG TPA: bifunctional diaminohydroxyphosphoribosylaminopyrimidine deaminase/5-amino-6-(5-phosphoribosylamino)uracil reductase RibD, partial [Polyangia bacterium]|nr:bifunctional diaminohydroxyphosphoribosylaminopyrimidine deaminase/5-amino-6-(5-phosphoribosylamino)uracil reductase RibD [Polyangia bacterium]
MSRARRFTPTDERLMRRALALAERGRGTTRPNPVVGAVVARGGRVLAEGFHRRAGLPHAEVNALARLAAGAARGATLYVNLEPCCHTGRTGPCTEALLAAGIARVVVGMVDPNPLVDGAGISRLRRAGVRVDVGCLGAECRAVNRAFAIWARARRPLVTLKAAASLDGFIAPAPARRGRRRAPVWLTGPQARRTAHALRAEHDAVL